MTIENCNLSTVFGKKDLEITTLFDLFQSFVHYNGNSKENLDTFSEKNVCYNDIWL